MTALKGLIIAMLHPQTPYVGLILALNQHQGKALTTRSRGEKQKERKKERLSRWAFTWQV